MSDKDQIRVVSDSGRFVTRGCCAPVLMNHALMILASWLDEEDLKGFSLVSHSLTGISLTTNSGVRVSAVFKKDAVPDGI